VTAGLHLPDWRAPAVGAVASGALLVGGIADLPWLWIPVVALQLVVVVTWHRTADAPAAASGALVGAGLAAIVDVVVATTEDAPSLGPVAVVLGAGYLIAVAQQLVRRDGRPRLVDSIATSVTLATLAAFGAAWVVLVQLPDGPDVVVVLAGASAAAAVGRLAPGMSGAAVAPVLAAVLAGWVLGMAVDAAGLGVALGVAAGLPTALAALLQLRLGTQLGDHPGVHPAAQRGAWLPSGAWPLLLIAPLGYFAERLLA
jgi:hypothetical protein